MSPHSTRQSSKIQMIVDTHHTNPDYSRNTRRTTPTIGTFPLSPRTIQSYSPLHVTGSSQRFHNTNIRTSKRARPGWYRPPPPEAYLIIRAHRRPVDGWGEDWNKKGDGWTFTLSTLSRSVNLTYVRADDLEDDGLVIKLEVRDRELNIVPPDNHILRLRLTRIILQYRIITATRTLTGIITSRISSIGGEKIIVFPLGNILSHHGTVVEVRLFDLGLCITRGRCAGIASLRISYSISA